MHWDRSFMLTLARICASRVLYGRGPSEFDKYRFMEKRLSLWPTFISDAELGALQRAFAPPEFLHLDEDKAAFAAHCVQAGLPTPEVVAVTAAAPGRTVRSTEYPVARDAHELARILAPRGDFEGFAKPRCGGIGWGAFGFEVRGSTVVTKAGTGDMSTLFARCASSAQGASGYVLQVRARQHAALAQWMPGPALGTMRILSFLQPGGEVLIPHAALKMPAPDAECDNVRLGAMQAGIQIDTGRLGRAVGRSPARPVVHAMDRHPYTGAQITGEIMPFWDEAKVLVRRAAHAFAMLPALGWDLGITDKGPMLIEANVMFGAPDLPYDRGLAAEMRALFARSKPL
jgi:hypothetical protein